MFECFHCGDRTVVWGGDFDPEDYGLEGEGVIHELHCSNCDADIIYYVIEREEKSDDRREQDL